MPRDSAVAQRQNDDAGEPLPSKSSRRPGWALASVGMSVRRPARHAALLRRNASTAARPAPTARCRPAARYLS
jgi:hypothetical protein